MAEVFYWESNLPKFKAGTWEDIKGSKRTLMESVSQRLEAAVRTAVGGTGKVAGWQKGRWGEGGGYAAVSPASGVTDAYGYAVGYVTNAINSGHGVRGTAVSRARRKRATVYKRRVAGKYFYERTATQVDSIAASVVKDLESGIAEAVTNA